MAFTNDEQAIAFISRAKQILILTRMNPTLDSISSALVLGMILKKMNKAFDIVAPGFRADQYPSFLPKLPILEVPRAMRAFHITLDISKTPLSELMYDVKNGELVMTIIPKSGEWQSSDVKTTERRDRYELILTVDGPEKERLGDFFVKHRNLLYRTNSINFDHSTENEHWGQINLVDLHAVSTTEVLYHVFFSRDSSMLDADIATALLAGMISNTKSFRTKNVTPKTLEISSQLLEHGAKREEIVKGLWRVQNIPGLKLWGRILSRLEHDADSQLVWSHLTEQDFIETGARTDSLNILVEDVLAYAPEAKVIVFFVPHVKGLRVIIHTISPIDARDLARVFGASVTREQATFIYSEHSDTPQASTTSSTSALIQEVLQRLQTTIRKNSHSS